MVKTKMKKKVNTFDLATALQSELEPYPARLSNLKFTCAT